MRNRISQHRKGFTLVEIMLVIVIIGILAALAIPGFRNIRMEAQNARFINDLRTFRDAMETYLFEEKQFPADGGSGNLHPDMREYIKQSDFEVEKTSIGGIWDIELNKSSVVSAVGVHRPTASTEQLLAIDAKIDDGDTAQGKLRLIAGDRFYWVLVEED